MERSDVRLTLSWGYRLAPDAQVELGYDLYRQMADAGGNDLAANTVFARLRAFSDWGWWVKLLVVPAAPVGHSLLSAVGAEAAASRGPEGGRPNLCGDLRGGCPSAPGSQRDHLARRPHGNDAAPSLPGRELALG